MFAYTVKGSDHLHHTSTKKKAKAKGKKLCDRTGQSVAVVDLNRREIIAVYKADK